MSALTRRAALACALAGGALARRAVATPAGRRPMFAAETLAQADAADVYVAPAGLTTRVAITPKSLVEIVTPRTLAKGAAGWDDLIATLKDAAAGEPPAQAREVRLGVVLKRAGAPVGSVFLEAPHGETVFAVVDDRPASAPASLAKTVAAMGAETGAG